MVESRPLPTPAECRYGEIQNEIEQTMMRKVGAALQEAAASAESELRAADLDLPPPPQQYFASVIHQHMYCLLCGADPQTFAGGRADAAVAVIRNSQNIARHYWGATIEVLPKHDRWRRASPPRAEPWVEALPSAR